MVPWNSFPCFPPTIQTTPWDYQSAEFDGYLSQAEDLPLNEGVEYYVQAEQYLNNQAVFYPLCYEKRFFAAAANVEGIIFSLLRQRRGFPARFQSDRITEKRRGRPDDTG